MKVQTLLVSIVLSIGAAATANSYAADPPKGSTGECKDGTFTTAEEKSGACSGHKGVKTWFAEKEKTTEKPTKAPTTSAAPAPPEKTAAPAKPAPAKPAPAPMPTEAAPGGGAGKVWVNTSSKVYHCSGDKWYGKTKAGEYMSEADAKAKGNHADHGKACG
jgi:Protein of unknown function (DUF3761)